MSLISLPLLRHSVSLLFLFFFPLPQFRVRILPSSKGRGRIQRRFKLRLHIEYKISQEFSLNRVSFTGLGSRTVWRGSPGMNSLYRYPLQRTRRLGANEWSRRKPLVRLAPQTDITETIPGIFFHRAVRHASFPRSATVLKATRFSQRNSANEIVSGLVDSEELRIPVILWQIRRSSQFSKKRIGDVGINLEPVLPSRCIFLQNSYNSPSPGRFNFPDYRWTACFRIDLKKTLHRCLSACVIC